MDDIYNKDIEAYIDDELEPDKRKRIEETMKFFPELEAYAQRVEQQNNMLKLWWDIEKMKRH